jgi:hypothetical protein
MHSWTSALEGGEWSASRSGCFSPREKNPGTHWGGDCVSLRAILDVVVKRKIPSPHWKSNLRTPIVQPIAQRYTDWTVMAVPVYGTISKTRTYSARHYFAKVSKLFHLYLNSSEKACNVTLLKWNVYTSLLVYCHRKTLLSCGCKLLHRKFQTCLGQGHMQQPERY